MLFLFFKTYIKMNINNQFYESNNKNHQVISSYKIFRVF